MRKIITPDQAEDDTLQLMALRAALDALKGLPKDKTREAVARRVLEAFVAIKKVELAVAAEFKSRPASDQEVPVCLVHDPHHIVSTAFWSILHRTVGAPDPVEPQPAPYSRIGEMLCGLATAFAALDHASTAAGLLKGSYMLIETSEAESMLANPNALPGNPEDGGRTGAVTPAEKSKKNVH